MRTLLPTSAEYRVPKQLERPSEFEVQAWLYNRLLAAGLDVRGEVRWLDKKTRTSCRFDLVIYKNGEAAEIIEMKWGEVKHKRGVENTRQGIRYRKFGVPVTFIYGQKDATDFYEKRAGING